jgi:phage/plasmid-like protein (TIGR03299 family)
MARWVIKQEEEQAMAHMIEEYDNMVSVREVPWHGLGVVLPDYAQTVWEAAEAANLLWGVSMVPVEFIGNDGQMHIVPKRFVVRRDDVNYGIGVVSHRYTPLQNRDMWEFVETFAERSGAKVETAGSLQNGARTWVLMRNGDIEYVKGDPINQYLLVQNAFNASQSLRMLLTDVRVVCNNTLALAIGGASNIFFVRHCKGAKDRLQQVDQALGLRVGYERKMAEAMGQLAAMQIIQPQETLEGMFPPRIDKDGNVVENSERYRNRMIGRIMELVETGAGHDLPGVMGTGYGLLQAVAEYADHEKIMAPLKDGDVAENRFRSILEGSASEMKQHAFGYLLDKAA